MWDRPFCQLTCQSISCKVCWQKGVSHNFEIFEIRLFSIIRISNLNFSNILKITNYLFTEINTSEKWLISIFCLSLLTKSCIPHKKFIMHFILTTDALLGLKNHSKKLLFLDIFWLNDFLWRYRYGSIIVYKKQNNYWPFCISIRRHLIKKCLGTKVF